MRAPLGEVDLGRAHNGFVAVDPEGYLLEFERFNPHEENTELLPRLGAVEPLGPAPGVETSRPRDLRVQATVFWLYYHDIDAALAWYEDVLGTRLLVDQGWAKVVPVSATGYLGFVDGTRGLHQATEEKAVTVSFFTHDVDGWFDVLKSRPDFPSGHPRSQAWRTGSGPSWATTRRGTSWSGTPSWSGGEPKAAGVPRRSVGIVRIPPEPALWEPTRPRGR
jgi:catechol 2,3-dioxygenase-like lactoylglutathione lyase family enzyme